MHIKRVTAICLVLTLCVCLLNGCAKEKATAKSLLQEAAEKTKDTASVSVQVTMDFDMTMEDPEADESYDASTTVQADMVIVKEPLSMQTEALISSSFDGEASEETATIYAIPAEEEGKIQVYTEAAMEGEETIWYKETVEGAAYETVAHNATLPAVFAETEDISFTLRNQTETFEDEEVYVLEGKVTGETLKKLAGALDTVADVLGLSGNEEILTSEAEIVYRIYKKSGMPASATIDMTEMVKPMMVDYGIGIDKTELHIVFKEFDAVSEIVVPQDGLDNAFDLGDMMGGEDDEDMAIEWEDEGEEGEEGELVEEEQEDVLIDTKDTTEPLKVTSIEDPAAMGEWIACYALASDGQFYQIGLKITDVVRGKEAEAAAEKYFKDNEEPAFAETPPDPLEFMAIHYEVYIPQDFPEEGFAGIEMYIIGEDGAYLSSDDYEFTDMFWIVQAETDDLYVGPGAYGKAIGLCTMEKDRDSFCVEVGDSWYHEGYIKVE